MLVANDIPNELLNIVKYCNFNVVPPAQRQVKLTMLKDVADKYLPRKKAGMKINYLDINLNNCPQELVSLVNSYDFTNVSTIKKKLAIPFIKSYLQQQGIYKK